MRRWCWGFLYTVCLLVGLFVLKKRAARECDTSEPKVSVSAPEASTESDAEEQGGLLKSDAGGQTETKTRADMAARESKKIALTFDDGPHPVYTQEMLDLLEKEQVPATFFLLGQNVELYGDLVKEISEEGHLIGNHTYHHVQITTLPAEQACEEIDKTNNLIKELTGKGTEYVRPPFGTWNEGLETKLNLIPVMWTIDTLDWTTQNVDWIVNQVVKNAEENDIILMHDSYESTVQAVERIITLLQADGFEFVTVDEVLFD